MERIAGKIVLLWGWRRAAVAFLAGALAVLAQAPFDFFAVCFVSFPVLVWLLDGTVPEGNPGLLRRFLPAFACGWWFGFGYFLAGLWWIGNALLVEAESFAWALPLAVAGLPAVLAVFYGFATALARMFWDNGIGRIAALAAAFGAAEWLRAYLFTGFPWNAIGYAAMPVPVLMQPVALVGLFGMNVLAVFVFAVPALAGFGRGWRAGAALALVIVLALGGYGMWRIGQPAEPRAHPVPIRIVQPSIDQSGKWDTALRDRIFAKQLEISAAEPEADGEFPQLIVWPETSVPFLFTERPDALAAIGELLEDGQVLLAGAVRLEGGDGSTGRAYNSVIAINDRGEIFAAADKVHLVPFGEYLPMSDLLGSLGLRRLVTAPGLFHPGSHRQLMEVAGLSMVPLICYEIIFPGAFDDIAPEADVIVNLTNDAWYGDTPGPYQHFRQARIRAVETGLPLIRAANNGVSAVVDPYGRIVDAFDLDVVGGLDVLLTSRPAAVFPYRTHAFWVILLFFTTIACIRRLLGHLQSN